MNTPGTSIESNRLIRAIEQQALAMLRHAEALERHAAALEYGHDKPRNNRGLDNESVAILHMFEAFVAEQRIPTIAEIAKAIGVSRQSIYKWTKFKKRRAALEMAVADQSLGTIRRGSKLNGQIECEA